MYMLAFRFVHTLLARVIFRINILPEYFMQIYLGFLKKNIWIGIYRQRPLFLLTSGTCVVGNSEFLLLFLVELNYLFLVNAFGVTFPCFLTAFRAYWKSSKKIVSSRLIVNSNWKSILVYYIYLFIYLLHELLWDNGYLFKKSLHNWRQ